jgi:hypothetical protein
VPSSPSAMGMDGQRSRNDLMLRDGLFDEMLGDLRICATDEHPPNDEPAEDIQHHQ